MVRAFSSLVPPFFYYSLDFLVFPHHMARCRCECARPRAPFLLAFCASVFCPWCLFGFCLLFYFSSREKAQHICRPLRPFFSPKKDVGEKGEEKTESVSFGACAHFFLAPFMAPLVSFFVLSRVFFAGAPLGYLSLVGAPRHCAHHTNAWLFFSSFAFFLLPLSFMLNGGPAHGCGRRTCACPADQIGLQRRSAPPSESTTPSRALRMPLDVPSPPRADLWSDPCRWWPWMRACLTPCSSTFGMSAPCAHPPTQAAPPRPLEIFFLKKKTSRKNR